MRFLCFLRAPHVGGLGKAVRTFWKGLIHWTASAALSGDVFPAVVPTLQHPAHPRLGLAGSSLGCRGGRGAGTHMQHWERGARMEISSWECLPNLGGEAEVRSCPLLLPPPRLSLCSPSGIVQVQQEAIVPKLREHLVVVPVHVPCKREFSVIPSFPSGLHGKLVWMLGVPKVMLG